MKAVGLRRKIATLVLLCFCSWPLGVTAQRTIVMRPTTPANTLDTLVRTSDLVLQCTIAAAKSIVMDGTIYTDYDVVPKRTLLQTNLTSAGKPGEVSRIAFRKGGGTALLDGELVQMKDVNFPDDAFDPGGEFVVFLKYVPEHQRYFLTAGPYAAFRIDHGRISPLRKAPGEERQIDGMPSESFLGLVQRLVATSRRP